MRHFARGLGVVGVVIAAAAAAPAQSAPPLAFPAPVPATGSKWDGLNLLLTRDRLQEIETAVAAGDPVAVQACTEAVAAAESCLALTPNPIHGVLEVPSFYSSQRAVQQQITAQIRGDGRAALTLAWGYALTGDARYSDASKQFVFAWVASLTGARDGKDESGFAGIVDRIIGQTGGDTALVAHYSLPLFIYAYDILNGFGLISDAEKTDFKRWLAPFVLYRPSEERFVNNHQCWQVLFMGAAAHATEDQHLLDMAVAYYRDGFHHQQIAADGAMWRELARKEKAATYTLMALEAMVQFVEIANHHGVDLRWIVADRRKSYSSDDLELKWVTGFKSSGIASNGGTLQDGLDALRDFENDARAWTGRWGHVIQTSAVNGPASASDWGWIFEAAYRWWSDPTYLPLMQSAPYGADSERAYTLEFATLIFRRF